MRLISEDELEWKDKKNKKIITKNLLYFVLFFIFHLKFEKSQFPPYSTGQIKLEERTFLSSYIININLHNFLTNLISLFQTWFLSPVYFSLKTLGMFYTNYGGCYQNHENPQFNKLGLLFIRLGGNQIMKALSILSKKEKKACSTFWIGGREEQIVHRWTRLHKFFSKKDMVRYQQRRELR